MLVVNVINGQRLETRKDLFRNTGVPLEELLGPLRIESGMCFVGMLVYNRLLFACVNHFLSKEPLGGERDGERTQGLGLMCKISSKLAMFFIHRLLKGKVDRDSLQFNGQNCILYTQRQANSNRVTNSGQISSSKIAQLYIKPTPFLPLSLLFTFVP